MIGIPLLIGLSVIAFVVIQLPPGDYLTTYIAELSASGQVVDEAEVEALRHRYGLDQPMVVQYLKWAAGIVRGDFGMSFDWNRPVRTLIGDRLGLTFLLAFLSLTFSWVLALFVGTYSATHRYSVGDYVATFLGFIGLAVPPFLLALLFMWVGYTVFGVSIGGLMSPEFQGAPMSWPKFADIVSHIIIPMIIVGMAGTTSYIRVLRANLIDELHKPYVITCRARGLSERRTLFEYPLRVAIIPFASIVGWALPIYISQSIIVSVVLNLPTTGPLLLQALRSQDMYLAGTFVLFLGLLTIVGTLVSDLILAFLDPRIRME
jgi:peptide/nickel transport system permease protein